MAPLDGAPTSSRLTARKLNQPTESRYQSALPGSPLRSRHVRQRNLGRVYYGSGGPDPPVGLLVTNNVASVLLVNPKLFVTLTP